MPQAGFEPTIPVFERAKTVRASERATSVIGNRDTQICIVTCMHVTIDGVWIGNWIYLTLTDPTLQAFITVSLIHTLKSCQSAMSSPVFW
jgi:hypothetical protein